MTDINPLFLSPPDAETQWRRFERSVQNEYHQFFDGEGPIAGARAPGRLDVMGGVADYSGSIVLEMPISEAAFSNRDCAAKVKENRVDSGPSFSCD